MRTRDIIGPTTLGLASVLLALLLVAGCGGQQEEPDTGGESTQSEVEGESTQSEVEGEFGEYVTAIPEADAFLALVAEEPPEGGEDAREVRAYLSDGRQLSEYFSDTASGNDVQLTSQNGVRLNANLGFEAANGTITFADGESHEFEAFSATGADGWYQPVIVPPVGGGLSATSWWGAELEGTRTEEGITGTITPLPDEGGPATFSIFDPTIEEGYYLWIVFSQLGIKGAKQDAPSTGLVNTEAPPNAGFVNQPNT